jgi:hypothetical protein
MEWPVYPGVYCKRWKNYAKTGWSGTKVTGEARGKTRVMGAAPDLCEQTMVLPVE